MARRNCEVVRTRLVESSQRSWTVAFGYSLSDSIETSVSAWSGTAAYSRARILRWGHVREALADRRFHRLRIEVADGDDGHEVGTIPVAVEGACQCIRERLEVLAGADREARGVLRAAQED